MRVVSTQSDAMAHPGGAGVPRHLALYGSLTGGAAPSLTLDLGFRLADRGECRIPGNLYDLGEYPGLRPGEGVVVGELYELLDVDALRDLDRFEGHDPTDPERSLFIRQAVRLLEPDLDAWVYMCNRDVSDAPAIESGDWRAHCAQRSGRAES